MKKFLNLAAVVCAAMLFVSCGAKDDATQVKEVMETYMKASTSFDYAKLKTIVTPESVAAIDEMEEMMKDIPAEYKKMAEESAKAVTFNPESIKIEGDVATASVSAMGMDMPITLKKVDGKWLLDLAAMASGSTTTIDEEIDVDDEGDVEEEVVEEKVEE